jgi:hypothetical protein
VNTPFRQRSPDAHRILRTAQISQSSRAVGRQADGTAVDPCTGISWPHGGYCLGVSQLRRDTRSGSRSVACAAPELQRLRAAWADGEKPQLWFCYHPYYKSVDPFGPALCAEFDIPHITAEASYSAKRNQSDWAPFQAQVAAQVKDAAVNIAFTQRDRLGLKRALPQATVAQLAPFIDTALFEGAVSKPQPTRLITVAMMRAATRWRVTGCWPPRSLRSATSHGRWRSSAMVQCDQRSSSCFRSSSRTESTGWANATPPKSSDALGNAGVYVWPGCGEAYGLAYLEAQAAGLPVVAQQTAGVPEVVQAGITGYLTSDGDVAAYAAAIATLLDDASTRQAMGEAARHFVLAERSLTVAAGTLDEILRKYAGAN